MNPADAFTPFILGYLFALIVLTVYFVAVLTGGKR